MPNVWDVLSLQKAMERHIHAPGGTLISRPLLLNEVDTDDEDPAEVDPLHDATDDAMNEDRMPIISDILQFMECPWDEEIEIQTMD